MTFEVFTIICFIATVAIVPIYMWLLYNIKNSWTSNSHDTQGGSMTILDNKKEPKVTWMDPIIKKNEKKQKSKSKRLYTDKNNATKRRAKEI
jgi:hypothetical protein